MHLLISGMIGMLISAAFGGHVAAISTGSGTHPFLTDVNATEATFAAIMFGLMSIWTSIPVFLEMVIRKQQKKNAG